MHSSVWSAATSSAATPAVRIRNLRNTTALCLLATLASSCFSPYAISRDDLREGRYTRQEELRLTYPAGSVILHDDWTLRYPVVEGRIDRIRGDVPSSAVEGTKLRTFNIDDARKIEIYAFSRSKTISAVVVPIVVFIGAAIGFTAPPPGAAPRPDGSNQQH